MFGKPFARGFVAGGFTPGGVCESLGARLFADMASGHKPLDSSEQTGLVPFGGVSSWSRACLRHSPGLTPKRRLKQVLNRPRWLKPHSSATLMIFEFRSRNREMAFNKRISILSAATDKPKN